MVQSISPPFTPHYPWLQGEPLFAAELNAAIANSASVGTIGTYSLFDFGGQSDGVTDDSAALNKAIAAILARGTGGKLIIPAGRTLLASAITANVPAGVALMIEGMGSGASEFYFANGTDGFSFKLLNSGTAWGAVNLHAFTVTTAGGPATAPWAKTGINIFADPTVPAMCNSHMSFRDLDIRGSVQGIAPTQWLNSMVLTGITGSSLDNVHLKGANASVADAGDVLLKIAGVQVGGTFNQYSTSINIINCGFSGGSVGILITGYVQGVFVTNSTVIGQYDSIRWAGTSAAGGEELAIANSTLNGVSHGVYIVYCNQCSISGSAVLRFKPSPGTLPMFAGIEINNSAFCGVIGNNIIMDATSATPDVGILLSDCGQSINTVVGNVITQYVTPATGIYMSGTTSAAVVVGNAMTTPNGGGIAQDVFGSTIASNSFNHVPLRVQLIAPIQFNNPLVTDPTDPLRGAARWFVGSDNSAESGGNTGSNFEIVAHDDTPGSTPYLILTLNRATGCWAFGIMPANAINDAAAAAAGVPVHGIYRNGGVLMVRAS